MAVCSGGDAAGAISREGIAGLRDLVVLGVEIAADGLGLAQRAAGLGQHREAFAVELGLWRVAVAGLEEDNFAEAHGRFACVGDGGLADGAAPSAVDAAGGTRRAIESDGAGCGLL